MLNDIEIECLVVIVARRIAATPSLGALQAWSTALSGLVRAQDWSKEVDRTWPMVEMRLNAVEFAR